MKFAERLSLYLKKKKISVQEFADSICVHNSAVYGYLSGKYEPNPETARRIRDITKKEITIEHIYE